MSHLSPDVRAATAGLSGLWRLRHPVDRVAGQRWPSSRESGVAPPPSKFDFAVGDEEPVFPLRQRATGHRHPGRRPTRGRVGPNRRPDSSASSELRLDRWGRRPRRVGSRNRSEATRRPSNQQHDVWREARGVREDSGVLVSSTHHLCYSAGRRPRYTGCFSLLSLLQRPYMSLARIRWMFVELTVPCPDKAGETYRSGAE